MKPAIPLQKKILRAGYRLLRICCYAVLIFVALDCLFPVNSTLEFAPLVRTRDGNVTHAFLTRDQQWRFETRLDELTPELKEAIIFKEDRYFHHHFGINPLAVGRALIHNIFRLKRTSGASTITMQVARLQAPKRRTYFNKAIEMFRAMQLETHYSKDEILRLYLNLVPYGSNIQGVKAASLLYFNKSPDQLSLAELTALSIIPNRPNSLVIGKDNPKIVLERNKWLLRFKEAKLFPPQVIDDALKEPLDAYRHNAPDGIPQLAWRLRFNLPATLDIHATIDPGMQLKAEQIVYRYVASLKLQQVFNAAVIITDNRTHEVLTYIGSPDFDDRAHQGQVDGVKALRSPGSTLKPFLYGLAYDAGMITPQTMIADVPVNLNGYTPENYDLQFRGNVSVDEALRHSLNIPAIKVISHTFPGRIIQDSAGKLLSHTEKVIFTHPQLAGGNTIIIKINFNRKQVLGHHHHIHRILGASYGKHQYTGILQKVERTQVKIRHRHLGRNLESVLKKGIEEQDEEKKQGFTQHIGYYMKLAYSNWHKEPAYDDMIRSELSQLTKGELQYEPGGFKGYPYQPAAIGIDHTYHCVWHYGPGWHSYRHGGDQICRTEQFQ
ncbi:putative penicillin-binding protein 1C [Ostertagia ostertagi]